jgi:hypothetical protein
MQTLNLKSGSLGHAWHAAHILLSILTCGWWLPIYGLHAVISVVTRPMVQVQVPEEHRVEYRNGHPNVLAPEEYLEPRTTREKALVVTAYASPMMIIAALVLGLTIRT